MSNDLVPAPIARARRIAGLLLVATVVAVVIGVVLLANWYFNQPVPL